MVVIDLTIAVILITVIAGFITLFCYSEREDTIPAYIIGKIFKIIGCAVFIYITSLGITYLAELIKEIILS